MNIIEFLLSENLKENDKYITNGELLFDKKYLKSIIMKKFMQKRKKGIISDEMMECIPFERGFIAFNYDTEIYTHGKYKYFIFRGQYKRCLFSKPYIDFIKKYLKPSYYTLVIENNRALLKFWDDKNNFIGTLAPCVAEFCDKIVF